VHRWSPPASRPARRLALRAGALVTLLGVVLVLGVSSAGERPFHHARSGFRNVDPAYRYSLVEQAAHLFVPRPARAGRTAPVRVDNDGAELRANGVVPTVTWVGHATVLIQLDGVNILTDPTWSDRASPVGFAGPKRLAPPGLRFEELPPIHAVVISHDHYDHLDLPTVRRLARAHDPTFFVPLGLGPWLVQRGVSRITELDWWSSRDLRGITFVCTPAQHSSGRGLYDRNRRLWSSWVIAGRRERLFFAGDTGYYGGFREIGQRLGPFDLAVLPIGGYSRYATHHPNHLNPEEAIALLEDIGGRLLVPMHWGTFTFNREPFSEPPRRLLREAATRDLGRRVAVLGIGQSLEWKDGVATPLSWDSTPLPLNGRP
jgi:N-acyl-phosphatidylethanolamine-hydrolysing phospholipase D